MTTSTATKIFTREEAKEADRVLNELYFETSIAERNLGWAKDSLRRLVDRETGWGRDREWGKTFEQALSEVTAIAETADPEKPWTQREAQSALDKLEDAQDKLECAELAVRNQSALWAQHGRWNRYSVVPGGHIHTNWRDCHTLRDTTTVLWAYQASGDSVDEAIEVYGTVLCTHCYPDAPVEKTGGKTLTDADGNVLTKAEAQAIKDAKDAEKAAKLAAKNAKALFVPGTTDLVQSPELEDLKTEIAVVRQLIEVLADRSPAKRCYRGQKGSWVNGEYVEVIDERYPTYGEWTAYAIAAIAAKHGKTVEEVKAEMDKKVRARNARAGR